MLSTGKLPLRGLLRNSVGPDMTSAFYRGRKARNQNKTNERKEFCIRLEGIDQEKRKDFECRVELKGRWCVEKIKA